MKKPRYEIENFDFCDGFGQFELYCLASKTKEVFNFVVGRMKKNGFEFHAPTYKENKVPLPTASNCIVFDDGKKAEWELFFVDKNRKDITPKFLGI